MKRPSGFIAYLLLLAAQIVAANFCNFTPLIVLSVLPALILMLPVGFSTIGSMCLAFILGFTADFFTDGALCLSVVALLPVALVRRVTINLVFGTEMESRRENISVRRFGSQKVIAASAMLTALFLVIYIWIDSVGTVPFWYNLLKFFTSLLVDTLLSIPVSIYISNSNELKVWR